MATIGTLRIDLILNSSVFNKGIRKNGKSLQGFTRHIKANAKSFRQLGRAAGMAGAAITASLTLAVRSYGRFDLAMREATAVSSVTEKQFDLMSKMAEKASSNLNIAASELAKGFYYLGSAGLTATEQIAAFKSVAKLSKAAVIDMGSAAEMVVDTMKGFKISFAETGKVTDVLTKAVTSSNMTFIQLGEAMSLVSGMARNANMTLEETTAVLGLMADVGVKGSIAGTSLKRALINLSAPASDATKMLKKLGVKVYDSNNRMKNFTVILAELVPVLEQAGEQTRNMALKTLFGARAIAGMTELIYQGAEGLSEFTKQLENAQGTTDEITIKQMASLWNQLSRIYRMFQKLTRQIGRSLEPELRGLADGIAPVIQHFSAWAEKYKELTAVMMKFTAALGLSLIGAIAMGFVLFGLGTTMMALTKVVIALGKTFALITPFLALMAAIGLAIYAIRAAWKQNLMAIRDRFEEFINIIQKGWDKFKEITAKLLNWFGFNWIEILNSVYKRFKEFIADIVAATKSAWAWLKGEDWATAYVKSFEETMKGLGDFENKLKETYQNIKITLDALGETTIEHWKDLWATVKTQAGEDMDALIKMLKEKMPALYDLFAGMKIPEFQIPTISGMKELIAMGRKWLGKEVGTGGKEVKELTEQIQSAYLRMYDDLRLMTTENYNYRADILNKLAEKWKSWGMDVKLINQWVAEETTKNWIQWAQDTGRFIDGVVAGFMQLERELTRWGQVGFDIVTQSAQAMKEAMSSIFFDTMRGEFDDFESHFTNMVRSIQRTFADAIAKMIAEWLMVKVIFGFVPGGAELAKTLSLTGAAQGAIFKGGFRPFDAGGIANKPTLGLIGEGTMPEAVVPLPHGRAIPVEMRGGQQDTYNFNIKIVAMDSKSVGQAIAPLSRQIASQVQQATRNNHPLRREQ